MDVDPNLSNLNGKKPSVRSSISLNKSPRFYNKPEETKSKKKRPRRSQTVRLRNQNDNGKGIKSRSTRSKSPGKEPRFRSKSSRSTKSKKDKKADKQRKVKKNKKNRKKSQSRSHSVPTDSQTGKSGKKSLKKVNIIETLVMSEPTNPDSSYNSVISTESETSSDTINTEHVKKLPPIGGGFLLNSDLVGSSSNILIDPPAFTLSLPKGSSKVEMIDFDEVQKFDEPINTIIPTIEEPVVDRHPPDTLNEDGLVLFSKNFQIVVKGGAIDTLVKRFSTDNSTDIDTITDFLLTYHNFLNTQQLIDMVFEHFDTPKTFDKSDQKAQQKWKHDKKSNQSGIVHFLTQWITYLKEDFNQEELEYLREKINSTYMEKKDKTHGLNLIELTKLDEGDTNMDIDTPSPIIPKSSSLLDFSPLELARQICLFEQRLYSKVQARELLNQSWNKDKESAPNVTSMITFFNVFSGWIASQILSHEKLKERVKVMKIFLKTAQHLFEFNNLNATQAISAAFNGAAVHRLYVTKSKVFKDKNIVEYFSTIQKVLSSDGSYHQMRDRIKSVDPPCIPYIGVYLTDLTFVEDGNPNYLEVDTHEEDIVNFEKMRRVAGVIKEILENKSVAYRFEEVETIYDIVSNMETMDENEQYQRSLEIESRASVKAYKEKTEKDASNANRRSFSRRIKRQIERVDSS
eukprot:TRINITY_DN4029_c0_g2_i1.p2 TRINITY_DN4029_c0_g2~~TRINITY_DN4029_c0_g2_i1.p2  ORF type:complete len:686 (+),score=141.66 TRINITY_DN4029_c0_g2_i1:58-2115(+)